MNNNTTNNGTPFFTVLLLIFTTLKLIESITWSWWWILSPAWIPWTLIGMIGYTIHTFSGLKGRNDWKRFE